MTPNHTLGIGLGHVEWHIAHRSPTASRMAYLFHATPGPLVVAEKSEGGPLPVQFRATRPLWSGQFGWIEALLTSLRQEWAPEAGAEGAVVALSVPASTTAIDRARLREMAVRCSWQSPRVVGNDVAIPLGTLGLTDRPVNVLLVHLEFEATEIALVTIFKGVVRRRARLRLRFPAHRDVDQAILAACLDRFGIAPSADDPAWPVLWHDAYRLRQQLATSQTSTLELSDPAWGKARGSKVTVLRNDLRDAFAPAVGDLVTALGELLEHHGISQGDSPRLLLAGEGLIAWDEVRRKLEAGLGLVVSIAKPSASAVGAARLADGPDDLLSDLAESVGDPWTQDWEARSAPTPRRAIAVGGGGEGKGDGSRFTPPEPGPAGKTCRQLMDAAFDDLDRLGHEDPVLARELARAGIDRARALLDNLSSREETAPRTDLLLDSAGRALARGNWTEVTRLAHQAYQEAPDDPAVFRRMVELLLAAADQCEDREKAVLLLEYALVHDQLNREVHAALARAYHGWAVELIDAGRATEALVAVRRGLVFDPFHAEAKVMEERLLAEASSAAE